MLRTLLICLSSLSLLYCQWLSFDFSKVDQDNFRKQVEPTILTASLTPNSLKNNLSKNKRMGISVSLPIGWDLSEATFESNPLLNPIRISGSFLISENLIIHGNMNLLSNSEETMQAAGYGCHFNSGSFTVGFSNGWVEGLKHLRVRYLDYDITTDRPFFDLPLKIGMGYNQYAGTILNMSNEYIPRKIENSILYLILGFSYRFAGVETGFQSKINSKFVQLNLVISRSLF